MSDDEKWKITNKLEWGSYYRNSLVFKSREGVIIEWPLNDLFNEGCDVIILSRMAVIIIF